MIGKAAAVSLDPTQPLCWRCEGGLTDTDYSAQTCTQCAAPLPDARQTFREEVLARFALAELRRAFREESLLEVIAAFGGLEARRLAKIDAMYEAQEFKETGVRVSAARIRERMKGLVTH